MIITVKIFNFCNKKFKIQFSKLIKKRLKAIIDPLFDHFNILKSLYELFFFKFQTWRRINWFSSNKNPNLIKMSSVKVAVRVRPFNNREISRACSCIIEMEGDQTRKFRRQSYKRNSVLKKSKLVLNFLKVHYLYLDYTTVLLWS